jgi:hypothetical protein
VRVTDSVTGRLLATATHTACHLELRDAYTPDDPDWLDWQAGNRFDPVERWRDWHTLTSEATKRGVTIRRARIISEPVTDYVIYEYDVTAQHNIVAGEQVRWLPRRLASDLLIPPTDFWVIDGVVVFNHFDGSGRWVAEEERGDRLLAQRLLHAFDAVWARAIPHESYQPPTA